MGRKSGFKAQVKIKVKAQVKVQTGVGVDRCGETNPVYGMFHILIYYLHSYHLIFPLARPTRNCILAAGIYNGLQSITRDGTLMAALNWPVQAETRPGDRIPDPYGAVRFAMHPIGRPEEARMISLRPGEMATLFTLHARYNEGLKVDSSLNN